VGCGEKSVGRVAYKNSRSRSARRARARAHDLPPPTTDAPRDQ